MPNFSNTLPPEQPHKGYDIRRTPPSQPLAAIVTCDQFLCCDTHYFQGRTTPCERITNEQGKTVDDSTCPACQRKQPWRSHVYVSAFSPKTHEHYIYECSTNAAKTFAEHVQAYKTLRGFGFQAVRPKGQANSKVVISPIPVNLSKITLPRPPDVAAALMVIWRLPASAIASQTEHMEGLHDHEGYAFAADHLRPDPAPLNEMRNQLDDASANGDVEQRRRDFLAGLEQSTAAAAAKKNGRKTCATSSQP